MELSPATDGICVAAGAPAPVIMVGTVEAGTGAAATGAVLFSILTATDPDTATLFFDMVRRGPGILATLPAERQATVQAEVAQAFRGVFLTIACFSVTIVVMAATLPMRRLQ